MRLAGIGNGLGMTQNPRVRSNQADSSLRIRTPSLSADDSNSNSDSETVTEIARTLVAHGGGAESINLAFDLVLHDLVEQARITTGATGAAIALTRDGDLVCRATSGENAPDLGVRVENSSKLVGDCVREGTIQRCADTEQDPRVNAGACHRLGVRSMLVAPIVDGKDVKGILQLFSASPNAFADEAVTGLPQFTQRIAESKREIDSALASVINDEKEKNSAPANPFERVPETDRGEADELPLDEAGGEKWSAVLVALIIVAAISLGFLMGWHGSRRERRGNTEPKASPPIMASVRGGDTASSVVSEPATSIDDQRSAQPKAPAAVPSGGLVIRQNGKIIYRSPGETSDNPARNQPVRLIHRVEPDYPSSARAQGIQGQVVLDVEVLGNGDVGTLNVVSGDPQLAQAAMQAVKRWKYERSGSDLQRQERVTIRFVLPTN